MATENAIEAERVFLELFDALTQLRRLRAQAHGRLKQGWICFSDARHSAGRDILAPDAYHTRPMRPTLQARAVQPKDRSKSATRFEVVESAAGSATKDGESLIRRKVFDAGRVGARDGSEAKRPSHGPAAWAPDSDEEADPDPDPDTADGDDDIDFAALEREQARYRSGGRGRGWSGSVPRCVQAAKASAIDLRAQPLLWFGALVPATVRQSQQHFHDAAKELVAATELADRIRVLEERYRQLTVTTDSTS